MAVIGTFKTGKPRKPHAKYVANPQTITAAQKPLKKPSFDTAVRAVHGDKQAMAELRAWHRHQQATKQAQAQTQALEDNALFGGSVRTVKRANKTISPVGNAIINTVSPVEAGKIAVHQAAKHHWVQAGVAGASIFPFGRGIKGVKAAEEIAQAATAADKLTPEARVLRAAYKAKGLQSQQTYLHSAERARRIKNAIPDIEAGDFSAARGHLKGKLPQVQFDHLHDLTDEEMQKLNLIIGQHPEIRYYDKIHLQDAIQQARAGKKFTPYSLKLVEKVFGPHAAEQAANPKLSHHVGHIAAEMLNIPRALLASFDVSAPFRQSLVAYAAHPVIGTKNLGPMFHALVSEKYYNALMHEITTRPTYPDMERAGVSLTGLGELNKREERFMSNYAEKITGGKYGPVRASGRAYTGFLNRMRADLFDHITAAEREAGIADEAHFKKAAQFVNWATGRGSLGPLEGAAVPLNTVFFSPRLFASRINALNPVWYIKADPFVRREALRGMGSLLAAGMTILGAAKLAGAKVGTDPTSADFGKIKFGNTRIDVWGGHQQIMKLMAQVGTGRYTSSTTGKTLRLAGGRSLNRGDLTIRFVEGKFAPGPALVRDWFNGTDFENKPFSWKKEMIQSMIPLLIQDTHDIYKETGSIPKAAAGYGVGAFGVGLQTYGPKQTTLTGAPSGSTPSHRGSGVGSFKSGPAGSLVKSSGRGPAVGSFKPGPGR